MADRIRAAAVSFTGVSLTGALRGALRGAVAVAVALVAVAPVAAAGPPPAPAATSPAEDVQIHGGLGTLEPDAVEAALGSVQPRVTACYQSALARTGYLGGTLEVKVRVGRDGHVRSVATVAPLGSLEVERCVVGILRGVAFPAPRGGEAEFQYSWTFQPRMPLQQWGADEVGARLRSHRARLSSCGGLPAGLRVAFFVTPGGIVGSAGVGADVALDERTAGCLVNKLAALRFQDPLGRIARVTYRF